MLLQITEPNAPQIRERRSVAVGIDLGTTHSAVAYALDGTVTVLADVAGRRLQPSVVAVAPDGILSAGYPALEQWQAGQADGVRSIKRLMGKSAEDMPDNAPFALQQGAGAVRIQLGGGVHTAIGLSGVLLQQLRTIAEAALGEPVTQAVITVPAYFDDSARQATRDAAKLAGLEVLRLVNEPTAAALAYGLDSGAEGVYAVYDLGGGTFDVSVLQLTKGVFQVLATGGDTQLGGDDFDAVLAERFLAAVSHDAPLPLAHRQRLLQAMREAREKLSQQPSADVSIWLPDAQGGRDCSHRFMRGDVEAVLLPLVKKTIAICQQVLSDAGITADMLSGIILVGGATRTPLVRHAVAENMGMEPLLHINPDDVVAVGAALQAAALSGGDGDTVLLDVLPLSLGLETMGGVVEKIIHRNSPIPTAKQQEFTTYQTGQTALNLHVLQGERETVEGCRSLAQFTLSGIPPMAAGAARVAVTFTVDADGLLTVEAQEASTGKAQKVTVKPSYGLDEHEMAQMLRAGYAHAADDMALRLLREARVTAGRILHGLEVALAADAALLDSTEQAAIAQAADALRSATATDDRETILAASAALEAASATFVEKRINTAVAAALRGQSVDEIAQEQVAPVRRLP